MCIILFRFAVQCSIFCGVLSFCLDGQYPAPCVDSTGIVYTYMDLSLATFDFPDGQLVEVYCFQLDSISQGMWNPCGVSSTLCSTCCRTCENYCGASASCLVCAPGTYSVAGSTTCTDCGAGKFASATGSSVCADCVSGTYSAIASTTCTACPNNTVSANLIASTYCVCAKGYEFEEAGGAVYVT